MLSPEEFAQIEQLINQRIEQKIEPLTEEIAALKAQLSKVDLLAIDNRNIRQSLGRIETTQESTRLDSERQEKRSVRFEKQTGDQLTGVQIQITNLDNKLDGKIIGLQTEVRQQFAEVRQQFAEHTTLLAEILARLPEKP